MQNISIEKFGKRIPWEIPVQLCIKDFLKEGDCAFDVGANIGALSISMSRIVGEKGSVHSFEPNPNLIPVIEEYFKVNYSDFILN